MKNEHWFEILSKIEPKKVRDFLFLIVKWVCKKFAFSLEIICHFRFPFVFLCLESLYLHAKEEEILHGSKA